jgi:hypothetical protein
MSLDRKRPPRWTSKVPTDSPIDGIDPLPNPIGVNMTATRKAEQDSESIPGAMGQENGDVDCDGTNPKIADVSAFATGKDMRNRVSPGSKSDPTPAMPGANV